MPIYKRKILDQQMVFIFSIELATIYFFVKSNTSKVGRENYFYFSSESYVKLVDYRVRNGLSENLCAITNGRKIKIILASYL